MKINDISVRIGGQAGDGALTTGDTLALLLHRMGLYVITYKDFPSQIRGIHTNYTIRASENPIEARPDYLDVLMAFDDDSIERHVHELREGGYLIYESSKSSLECKKRTDLHVINVPLRKIAMETTGVNVMKNTVALGVLSAIVGLDRDTMVGIIEERFLKRKGAKVVEANIKAFDAGIKYFEENFENVELDIKLEKTGQDRGYLLMGNEAVAFGALVAGCRFFAGYPITPASEIMEWLTENLPKYNGVMIQAEDELAAINMAIGAAYAGVRAMTATSGPGFSLMAEGLSYAHTIEAPLVVALSNRAGPSTGMPTKSEQSDVFAAIFSGHGDNPRIVLAPRNAKEAYLMTIQAFNLSEKYQTPVVLFLDQFLSQNKYSVDRFPMDFEIDRGKLIMEELDGKPDGKFKRYEFTEDGVSPRVIPGVKGGIHWVTGVEHNEEGHISTYTKIRNAIMEKRLRKYKIALKDLPEPEVYGNTDTEKAVITFGTTTGPVLEAMSREPGLFFTIQIKTLWPFESNKKIKELVKGKEVYVAEVNALGQLGYVTEHFLKREVKHILKYNGRPFRPIEILEALKK